ncbi:MAG: zinc-binding dehydrogenase [Candidatus Marinimicrobia bacterium]|nr:zinc-binding dehydrogenase [Candidatus Neomarinimicrobiota bacterium]
MKVIRIHGPGDLQLHHEPDPVPGPGETLVTVGAVAICGSDLHWFSEGSIGGEGLEQPLILGHEFSGVITDGEGHPVRVAVDPAIPCEECRHCREGQPNLCQQQRFAGHGHDDGALREQLVWPDQCLHPLPDSFDIVDGALLEPLGIALHAADLGDIKPGMRVGVFGCGPIGLLLVQLAQLSGATQVIATDLLPHRLVAARAFGATQVFQVDEGGEYRNIWAATGQEGVDVAFEVAGAEAAVETAIASAAPGATVVLVGIPADERTSFHAATARRKGLTIKLCRRMKHTYPRAIRLVETGLIDVRSLVTHHFPMDEYEQAFAIASRREGLKIVIEPTPST